MAVVDSHDSCAHRTYHISQHPTHTADTMKRNAPSWRAAAAAVSSAAAAIVLVARPTHGWMSSTIRLSTSGTSSKAVFGPASSSISSAWTSRLEVSDYRYSGGVQLQAGWRGTVALGSTGFSYLNVDTFPGCKSGISFDSSHAMQRGSCSSQTGTPAGGVCSSSC